MTDDADSTADADRSTDIEDQGQDVDAPGDVDADLGAVEGDETDPGPEGEGAAEATQRGDEAPTDVVDAEGESADE